MKRWFPLFCVCAALCATLAVAAAPTPANCHEMAALTFGDARLLGSDDAEAALSDYFAAREAAYRGDASLLSADAPNLSESVAENNALRAELVREMESRLGLRVLDADVTAQLDRERTARNADGTLTLYVYEWTFYDYDDLADGEGGSDVSGFGTWHILTVAERPDGSYEILADEYDESDILGINTLSEEHVQELLDRAAADAVPEYDAEPIGPASLLAINYYANYDVEKAVAYSEKYWNDYNPAYANFNAYGGDCANFTSQSIYAGGMPQVVTKPYASDGWYYKTSTDRSATWASATSLHHWMRDNRGHRVTASKSTVYTGSPVFYSKVEYSDEKSQDEQNISFVHAVLCVGTNSAGTPIINSHNSNRYHAMWNYYSGTKTIDTVQLTSQNFGDFDNYVKPGDSAYPGSDFYAQIFNASLDRYVTNDGQGAVSSRAKADTAQQSGQVWHFVRQDDDSFQILSVFHDGTQKAPALAAEGGEWASRTPICTEDDAAKPGQRWYLYWDEEKEAYLFRPTCSDRIMDIFEGSDEEGAGLWLFSKNGTTAQLFQINKMDWVELDKPVLHVKLEGTEGANVMFTWEAVSGALSHTLRVTQDTELVREVSIGRTTSYALRLDPGSYQATLEAFSANKRTSNISDPVSFTVYTSFVITFHSNGGESEPVEQMKIEAIDTKLTEELPVRKGYTFVSWNTQSNGTGVTYMPGDSYSDDKNLTLYAQWTPSQFTVILEPNGGILLNPEYTVTYTENYGEMPVPVRDGQYEFAGWYTDILEGTLITAETRVNVPSDHILYAHWNSTAVYLLPDVQRSGNRHRIITSLHRIPEGVLFACGYLNGQMVETVSGPIASNQTEVTLELEGEFDKILVMAFDNTKTMRPLCKSESVTRF